MRNAVESLVLTTSPRHFVAVLAIAVGVMSGIARAQSTAAPSSAAPFELSQQESEQLDHVLTAWEERSGRLFTLNVDFTVWEYDGVYISATIPAKIGSGEIKYRKPDKCMHRVKEIKRWLPAANDPEQGIYDKSSKPGDHWVCDGKSIFEYRYEARQVIEWPLPRDLKGKAVSLASLPFLFGVEKQVLLDNYFMRLVTPPNTSGQIWVEAYPRSEDTMALFTKAEIILAEDKLHPVAVQLYSPNMKSRVVYEFRDHRVDQVSLVQLPNDDWSIAPHALSNWRHIVLESIHSRMLPELSWLTPFAWTSDDESKPDDTPPPASSATSQL